MITSCVFPSKYIQGAHSINLLKNLIHDYGKKPLILCSPSILRNFIPGLNLETDDFAIVEFGRECSYDEIDRVYGISQAKSSDTIIGIGGGKTLDTARVVPDRLHCPLIIVPGIASTDAPCEAVSVIYTNVGQFCDVVYCKTNPELVLADTKIIVQAPARYLVSGMGDALATWFEADACRINYSKNISGYIGSMTAYSIARLCFDTILEYGYTAKLSNEVRTINPAFEHVVEANTLLSGIGFESGGLGAAHSIHNGLTGLPQTQQYYHGEKVAIGVLASLFLSDKPI